MYLQKNTAKQIFYSDIHVLTHMKMNGFEQISLNQNEHAAVNHFGAEVNAECGECNSRSRSFERYTIGLIVEQGFIDL